MKVDLPNKWVDARADDCTRDVAARTLRGRLVAVLQCLSLAARKADESIEYVHDVRVWTRRSTAALMLYEDLIPRRRFAWMKKQLRRIRRAANDARNCDVLIVRLTADHSQEGTERWLEVVREERAESQEAVCSVFERLEHRNRFARRIEKLVQKLRIRDKEHTGADSVRFGDWARTQLQLRVEQFFAAGPSDSSDDEALHQLRIRGKELRYALELLAGAWPAKHWTGLYRTIVEMQDRLGEINDAATASTWLRMKLDDESDSDDEARWRQLLGSEQTRFHQLCTAFREWCTPQCLQDLRGQFEAKLRA